MRLEHFFSLMAYDYEDRQPDHVPVESAGEFIPPAQ
jgi:hypothetical protein